MASMDDAEHDESGESAPPSRDRGESGFGPPVSGFGPPVGDFGPPVDAFGPPTGGGSVGWQPADGPDRPSVGWQPADTPERPSLGWQPVDQPAPPTVPAPPQQYRAPDSTGSREIVQPQQYRAPDSTGSREIVQPPQQYRSPDSTGSQETVRYSDQSAGQQGGPDTGSRWRTVPPRSPGQPEQSADKPQSQYGKSGQPRSLWDDDDLAKKLAAPREPSVAARGSSTGKGSSLWDDDDLVLKVGGAPGRQTSAPSSDGPRRNRGVLIGGIAAAVVVVLAIVGVIVFAMRGSSDKSAGGATSSAQADKGLDCQTFSNGALTTGNGPGDTLSGPGAILGFEYGIYTERSAAKAQQFVVPHRLDVSQQVIDAYPKGITYCLRINTLAPDTFKVDITELHPNGDKPQYGDVFSVQNVNGKFLISQLIQKSQ
ncbi:hypothetical protein [Nocardia miyunensis]|uniref:hypothetical protein n=1 Tax=Nocardia miyunensis TaxID=282684 RepID=UPI000A84F485|nr:hypothetical protein [Nocardia miyunensis]